MSLTKTPRAVYQGDPADPAYQPNAQDARLLAEEMRAEYQAIADGQNRLASAALATTANITLSGEQTIDGTLTSASRVLVKNQSTASQNGVYVTGAGAWTRATDADSSGEIALAYVHVIGGSTNAGKRFQVVNSPVLGSDPIVWAEVGFSADLAALEAGLGDLATADTVGAAQIDNGAVTTDKIPDDAVTNAKLAPMAEATFKGRAAGAGTGDATDLTVAQVKAALGVTATGDAVMTGADAAAIRSTLDLGMLDTANDALTLGGETRLETSDYRLIIEDAVTGAVYAYIDDDGNADGFGADGAASEAAPIVWGSYSSDWRWPTTDVLLIVVGHGQSNARGQGTTAASTTPVYAGKALMPSNGPQVTGATGQALVDLVEIGQETPGSGLVNNLIAKVAALTGAQPYVCYLNGAVSATPLRQLNRGSAAWAKIMGGIEDAASWARSNGLVPLVLGMTWTQGEESTDRQRTGAEYLADLDNLARDFAADAKARTGQTDDPRLYVTQIYSGHNNEPTDLEWAEWGPNVAAVEGHVRSLIRLAGPMYQLEIQTADYLHLTAAGQYAQGAMQAEAIYADWAGAGWSPIRPLRAWLRTSSIVRIEYAVPGNGDLSLVTGEAVTDTTNSTKGFQVFTAGRGTKLTISSVTVPAMTDVNDRYVDITLSAPVTGGAFVTYAMRRDTNGQNGPGTGGRGCLATGSTYTPLSGGAQRHWAAAHSLTAGA